MLAIHDAKLSANDTVANVSLGYSLDYWSGDDGSAEGKVYGCRRVNARRVDCQWRIRLWPEMEYQGPVIFTAVGSLSVTRTYGNERVQMFNIDRGARRSDG